MKEKKANKKKNDTGDEYRYFLESNFVGVIRLFVLINSGNHAIAKRFTTRRYYQPKGAINNYKVIVNEKSFYDQRIDSDIK